MIKFASQIGQFVIVELDNVKVVKDQGGLRQVGEHGVDLGRRHIGGYRFDLDPPRGGVFAKKAPRRPAPLPSPTNTTAPLFRSSTIVR